MANLSIALIGLNRISTSLGLALRRYMHKGGKHQFKIVGHDPIPENEKEEKPPKVDVFHITILA